MLKRMADCESVISRNVNFCREKIAMVMSKTQESQDVRRKHPRLVAVSKTKPISDILEAYSEANQRHFGENYIQELIEKSNSPEILQQCPDIRWHFIGRLQSNKAKHILQVPNLYVMETIGSAKLASRIQMLMEKSSWSGGKMRAMVQVNTSHEDQKGGCAPEETVSLVKHILKECPNLDFIGLMTIGRFDHDPHEGPNPDFQVLMKCREDVSEALQLDPHSMELSMGMSNDFEHAVEMGSTSVRVGSTIFGARQYPAK